MADKMVSQKTIVEVKRVLESLNRRINYGDTLYGNGFPDWFVFRAAQGYQWDWMAILLALRRGGFFYTRTGIGFVESIVPDHEHTLTEDNAHLMGEVFIHRLAAFVSTLSESESLLRSLQLDGFEVNKEKLKLVPLEGPASAAEEEDRLTRKTHTPTSSSRDQWWLGRIFSVGREVKTEIPV